MRSKLRRVFGLSLAIVLTSQSGAFAADPSYYPSGPQTNVAVSTVSNGGWTRCYNATYSATLPTLETLRSQCQGEYVLYAGGSAADTSNLLLLAAGQRSVVFAGTDSDFGTIYNLGNAQLSNGTYFYAEDSLSVGFTKNATVRMSQADLCGSIFGGGCAGVDDGSLRISWHGNGLGVGGWRLGAETELNGSNAFVKEIWVSNGSPRAMPLVQTTPVGATLENNLFTCTAGNYKVGMSAVEISSVKYQLFVNDTLMSSVVFDKGNNIPDSMKSAPASKISSLVSAKEALFDLTGMSSYSAYCTVEAFGFGSSSGSASATIQDPALIAAANAKAQAWEDQRAAATAANFTKEAREARKRAAARGGN